MIRSLYTAATGMNAQDLNVSVIANNLANVNTIGFKRSRPEFQDLLYQNLRLVGTLSPNGQQVPTGAQLGLGTKTSAIQKIFIQGDFSQTQNPLDIAIQGKGFFQVSQPDGTIGYTRAGSFSLDNTGQLVTSEGLALEPAIYHTGGCLGHFHRFSGKCVRHPTRCYGTHCCRNNPASYFPK